MNDGKPYIDYTFTGVDTFQETLDRAMISYGIMLESEADGLFTAEPRVLNRENDTITLGHCTKNNITLYFLEFGIMIAPSIRSHIVFIFDHRPDFSEMRIAAKDLENLTVDNLREKHGDSIPDIDEIDNISDVEARH